jgi:hypothetical protein
MRRMIPGLIWSLAGLLAAALPAQAQPADPIGALLEQRAQEPPDDEPDAAGQPPAAPQPAPTATPPALPAAPIPYAPARPQLTAPVHIEETGKTPDAPPTLDAIAYDTRLRSSYASAQGFQGPLDGGWTLATPSGEPLFALQLVDKPDRLEGAWRDLRRKAALTASGLVDDIARTGPDLTLRIAPAAAAPVAVTLHATADGRWTGELAEGGASRSVILSRTGP